MGKSVFFAICKISTRRPGDRAFLYKRYGKNLSEEYVSVRGSVIKWRTKLV